MARHLSITLCTSKSQGGRPPVQSHDVVELHPRHAPGSPADVFPLGMAPFIGLTVDGQEAGRPALMAEARQGFLPATTTARPWRTVLAVGQ